jgi:hypothetical protein
MLFAWPLVGRLAQLADAERASRKAARG